MIIIIIITTTAIGLSPGGSSPTLVQTKLKIHKTTKQLTKQQNITRVICCVIPEALRNTSPFSISITHVRFDKYITN